MTALTFLAAGLVVGLAVGFVAVQVRGLIRVMRKN